MDYTEILKQHPNLIVKKDEPLSNYTYTETGGPADLLFFPQRSLKSPLLLIGYMKRTPPRLSLCW